MSGESSILTGAQTSRQESPGAESQQWLRNFDATKALRCKLSDLKMSAISLRHLSSPSLPHKKVAALALAEAGCASFSGVLWLAQTVQHPIWMCLRCRLISVRSSVWCSTTLLQ